MLYKIYFKGCYYYILQLLQKYIKNQFYAIVVNIL